MKGLQKIIDGLSARIESLQRDLEAAHNYSDEADSEINRLAAKNADLERDIASVLERANGAEKLMMEGNAKQNELAAQLRARDSMPEGWEVHVDDDGADFRGRSKYLVSVIGTKSIQFQVTGKLQKPLAHMMGVRLARALADGVEVES